MSDKCNCYRFSPRDSLSGAVAQIADYLSKHPGWNETELRAFVDGIISSASVETFNGRSGNVTLNKDDVNNLLIANCYFAEADETIESIDVLALYKLGIRIVFTQYSSEVDGYTLAYGIEYYPATDTAKAYLFSSGSGGGTGAIVSVNGKTGIVVLKASDILMNNGDSVEYAVSNAKTIANAAYSPNNPPPYPVNSVNSKTGSVLLKVVDVSNGDSVDDNAYIFIDETENYPDIIAPDSNKLGGQIPSYYATAESVNSLKSDLDSKAQFGDPYDGVDLTVKHAKEIEDYASPWSWIKARIAAGNFSQLHVGDYIPFTTTNGRTFQAQIAGINPYKDYGDTEVDNHIDFITRELWPDTFQMNLVPFNNGTSDTKQTPWLASNGYLFVNSLAGQVPNGTTLPLDMVDKDYTAGGMYFYLPDDLKSVIVEKRVFAPSRYSASGVLTNDNNGAWVNLGKLWLPDEYEVTGARLMTSTGWLCGGYVQYPIFAGNMNRLKRTNGNRNSWWLSSAGAGNSTSFVSVGNNGLVAHSNASYAFRAPFCFRVS